MKKLLYTLLLAVFGLIGFNACSGESFDADSINKQTLIVFMPWSGNNYGDPGLLYAFNQNLDSIKKAIVSQGRIAGKVIVFKSENANKSVLYEIKYNNGACIEDTLKTYVGNDYATSAGITGILDDIKTEASALNYAMIIGCHGTGWTYKEDWSGNSAKGRSTVGLRRASSKHFYKDPRTRFYGSANDMNYQTNISDLAQGIKGAGLKMQFILFDDCYMANVETAYELKDATYFLIGSTSEVMAEGMPYKEMWTSLWSLLNSQTPSYSSVPEVFNKYYNSKKYYGTLSVIDCQEMDGLAQMMKEINTNYTTFPDSLVDSLQVLDGYNTPIFYDFGDYVAKLCKSNDRLNDFNSRLDKAVRASSHTDSIYSFLYGYEHWVKVNTFSGMTISEPSRNGIVKRGIKKTAWWRDTH